MSRPHAIEERLDAEELEELRAFCRERRRTVDDIYDWVLLKGYSIARSSAGTWRQKFEGEQMQERFSASGALARSIKGAVAGGDFNDVAEAATAELTRVVFEQALRLQSDGEIDPLDVQRMTKSLNNLVLSKGGLVRLLAAKFDAELAQRQQARPGGQITPEDIAKVRAAVFGT